MVQMRLRGGKADFIKKQLPDGKTENVCLCNYNADLSITGCFAQVPKGLVEEVIAHNGQYSNETRKAFRAKGKGKLPDLRCDYCYARRVNWGKVTPVTIGDKTIGDFEAFKPEVIRIGKMTEAGHYYYHPLLAQFLELCEKYNSRVIFPTKMLQFNENISALLVKTKSVLNFSIGADNLETGACSQGYTNAWRVKQAQNYFQAGVNTTLTIVCDVTQSIEENARNGSALILALETQDIPKRILPLRPNSNKVTLAITGKSYGELIYHSPNFPEGTQILAGLESCVAEQKEELDKKPYIKKPNAELIPRFFHPDFSEFVQRRAVCGRIGDFEYCDKCTLHSPIEPFPASQLVKVEYSVERKNGWKDFRNYKAKKHRKLQPDLPFEV